MTYLQRECSYKRAEEEEDTQRRDCSQYPPCHILDEDTNADADDDSGDETTLGPVLLDRGPGYEARRVNAAIYIKVNQHLPLESINLTLMSIPR